MGFVVGQWVRHRDLDRGPGRVEAIGEHVVVRFPEYEGGKACRFKPPARLVVDADQIHDAAAQRLAASAAVPRKVGRPPDGQVKVQKLRSTRTAEQLVERFLTLFPDGFSGQQYKEDERDYKLLAAKTCRDALPLDELDRLVLADDRAGLAARFHLSISRILNLLSHPVPTAQFGAMLKREETVVGIASSFVRLMREADHSNVAAYLRALREAASPRLTWPFATLLPALLGPDRHVFVQPEPFWHAAGAIGYAGPAKPLLDPEGFALAHAVARGWLDRLAPLGATDFIDVQSFIYCTKPEKPKVSAPATSPTDD